MNQRTRGAAPVCRLALLAAHLLLLHDAADDVEGQGRQHQQRHVPRSAERQAKRHRQAEDPDGDSAHDTRVGKLCYAGVLRTSSVCSKAAQPRRGCACVMCVWRSARGGVCADVQLQELAQRGAQDAVHARGVFGELGGQGAGGILGPVRVCMCVCVGFLGGREAARQNRLL
jgi:hypothetical protein